jgi:hypothetical protein
MAQIDASIYNAFAPKVRSIQDYDNERMQGQMNALSLTQNRQKVDEYQRKVEQENALRTFQRGLAGKTRPEQAQAYLDAGYVDQANALTDAEGKFQTAQANVRQSDAAALSSTATAGKVGLEAKIKASDFHVQQLGSVNDPQSALAWAEAGLKSGIFTPEQYQAGLQRIQQAAASPQAFSQWRQMALQGGMSATEQLKQKLEQQKAMETQRHNRSTEGIQGGQLAVSQARLNMDRQNATGAVTYQQDANGNMVALPTRPGAGAIPVQQVIGADGRPIRGRMPGKGQAMSATAQKELFEADDGVAAAKGALTMLAEARGLNDKAYSGVGANLRAKVVSNLGGSDAADATVNLENIIGGQALASLKSIFGAAPTEGERKILMDLQASSDKTPKQRADIIARGEQAVQRRLEFNTKKAAALRSGTYFAGDQGAEPQTGGAEGSWDDSSSAPVDDPLGLRGGR